MVFAGNLFGEQAAAHLTFAIDGERVVLHNEVIELPVVYSFAYAIVFNLGYTSASGADELYVCMLLKEEVVLSVFLIHGLAYAL